MALKVSVTFLDGTEKELDLRDVYYESRFHVFKNDCISRFAFRNDIRKIVIPKGITIIDSCAFEDCIALEEVIFPDTLIEIADKAFYGCQNLNEIVLPNTVRHIGDYAFAYSGLKKVSVRNPEKDDVFFKAIERYNAVGSDFPFPDFRLDSNYYFYIGKGAFQNCKELTDITLPDCINRIRERAFEDCKKLETVTSSTSFKSIEHSAFCDCCSLKQLPSVENEIGFYAFFGCTSLEIATFPRTLEKISHSAFKASGLKKVSFSPKTAETTSNTSLMIGKEAFSDCEALEEFTFPKNVKHPINPSILQNCQNLRHIFFER